MAMKNHFCFEKSLSIRKNNAIFFILFLTIHPVPLVILQPGHSATIYNDFFYQSMPLRTRRGYVAITTSAKEPRN